MMVGHLAMSISQASAGAERVFEILDAVSDVKDKQGAILLPSVEGRVVFDEVSFRYAGMREEVLSSINFSAEPGQTIALLGATGSGKSTVINLIPRFYDVSAGRITLDGHDIRDLTLESLRRQIGIVLQEPMLFGSTIRENVAFGKSDATEAEVIAAAEAAEAHEFVCQFPDGYETVVGERGVTLSGGQRQRIAIARALLIQPKILILDDSTSSVDFATETRIQTALERLRVGRLSFVIAQRLSTVAGADKIIVLDQGRIAANGKHQELLRESPLYAEIYYSQLERDETAVGGKG
jgi:ATP-binding cassette subfamily B protein